MSHHSNSSRWHTDKLDAQYVNTTNIIQSILHMSVFLLYSSTSVIKTAIQISSTQNINVLPGVTVHSKIVSLFHRC